MSKLPFTPITNLEKWAALAIFPADYSGYGGEVVRWSDPNRAYPDCSCGCIHADFLDGDWLICRKPGNYREGLLTWEHMAGAAGGPDGGMCFESEPDEPVALADAEEYADSTIEGQLLLGEIARLRARLRIYAEKCADIEAAYHDTEWADGQVIEALMENRILEVGLMASDDLREEQR